MNGHDFTGTNRAKAAHSISFLTVRESCEKFLKRFYVVVATLTIATSLVGVLALSTYLRLIYCGPATVVGFAGSFFSSPGTLSQV